MKIAVFGTNISDEYKSKAEEVIHSFIANGFDVSIYKDFKSALDSASFSIGNLPEFTEIKENSFDILLSLGGDGTFLKCAHLCYATNTPILGINFGKLGFLAQTNPDDIDFIIKDIQNKKFSIRQRTVLDFSYATDKEILNGIGLNEITLQKSNTVKLIKINDDQFAEEQDSFGFSHQCKNDSPNQADQTEQQTKQRKIGSNLWNLRQPHNPNKFQNQQNQALITVIPGKFAFRVHHNRHEEEQIPERRRDPRLVVGLLIKL